MEIDPLAADGGAGSGGIEFDGDLGRARAEFDRADGDGLLGIGGCDGERDGFDGRVAADAAETDAVEPCEVAGLAGERRALEGGGGEESGGEDRAVLVDEAAWSGKPLAVAEGAEGWGAGGGHDRAAERVVDGADRVPAGFAGVRVIGGEDIIDPDDAVGGVGRVIDEDRSQGGETGGVFEIVEGFRVGDVVGGAAAVDGVALGGAAGDGRVGVVVSGPAEDDAALAFEGSGGDDLVGGGEVGGDVWGDGAAGAAEGAGGRFGVAAEEIAGGEVVVELEPVGE